MCCLLVSGMHLRVVGTKDNSENKNIFVVFFIPFFLQHRLFFILFTISHLATVSDLKLRFLSPSFFFLFFFREVLQLNGKTAATKKAPTCV